MMEKIDETLRILAEYDAPEDIVEQVQELKKHVRIHPTTDCTYDMIQLFNKRVKKHAWAKNAIEVWIGKMPEYDPKRENPKPFLNAANAMSGDNE